MNMSFSVIQKQKLYLHHYQQDNRNPNDFFCSIHSNNDEQKWSEKLTEI